MASRSLLAVLVFGTLLVASAAGAHESAKSGVDEAQAKVGDGAAAAQESAQSWTGAAKEKLSTLAADAKHKIEETVAGSKDAAYDSAGVAKEKTGEAQDASQSYLEIAKEKLNAFTKYVSKSFEYVFPSLLSMISKSFDSVCMFPSLFCMFPCLSEHYVSIEEL